MSRWYRGLPGSVFGDAPRRWLLAALVLLPLLVALGGESWRLVLRYERAGLARGQWWRLFSAHFVHLGWTHTILNLAGLALIWHLYALELPVTGWILVALAAMLGVDAGLWLLQPEVLWYVGASGLLHGMWSAGAWRQARRGDWLGSASLALLSAKLALEHLHAGSLLLPGQPVVTAAHLYGALAGLAAALPMPARRSL